jgi:xanthine dehydrogenase small subunit
MTAETVLQAAEIIQSEISPISDVRGTDEYKRQLLRQLFIAHCVKLFPESVSAKELLATQ